MDTRQLRHFVAVAETLHFGRAAERLGMTQPPLSQSIQALEQEIGMALFRRTKRSVALTETGMEWLPAVQAVLDGMAALPDIARRLRDGEAGRLALSFVSSADYSVLPELVRRYTAQYPEVELTLTEATSDVQITRLLADQGHAGLIIPPTHGALPPSLAYQQLVSEPLVAAVPAHWLETGRLKLTRGRLSPGALIQAPLIVFPRPSAPAFHDLVTNYYAACGGHVRIAQQAIQMQTIISLVSAGMGIALVPESLRHLARTGVCYVDLQKQAPTLETGLVWRRDDASPPLRHFLALARALHIR